MSMELVSGKNSKFFLCNCIPSKFHKNFYKIVFILFLCHLNLCSLWCKDHCLKFMLLITIGRFVLFKSHYDKYLRLSLKYEEARNIAYYLEEKYHEIKVSLIFHVSVLT